VSVVFRNRDTRPSGSSYNPVAWRARLPRSRLHRCVCTWLLWLLLAGHTLSMAASMRPTDALSFRAACGLTSLPSRPGEDEEFFTGLAGSSGECSLLRTRYERQSFGSIRSVSLVSDRREYDHTPPRSAVVPAFFPWRFFFPWKFAPPPADPDSAPR
jgi:hypothetical protein